MKLASFSTIAKDEKITINVAKEGFEDGLYEVFIAKKDSLPENWQTLTLIERIELMKVAVEKP